MDLVREALLKLGKEDESAEDILFTAEGAKAKKDITDIIVKLLGCDDCNKNDFKIDPKKNEALSKNKSNAYKIEYFLNTAGAERRPRELRDIKHDYQTIKIKASSDLEALEQAFLIQTEEDYYDGIFEDYGVEDTVEGLKDYFDSIDVSEGSPIICRVLRGSTVIYDSGITKDQLLGELDESTEKGEKCVLCGKEIKGHGNNPAPVKDSGRCCDDCNKKVVIPARIKAVGAGKLNESKIKKYPQRALAQLKKLLPYDWDYGMSDAKGEEIVLELFSKAAEEVAGEKVEDISPSLQDGRGRVTVYFSNGNVGSWDFEMEQDAAFKAVEDAGDWQDVYDSLVKFVKDNMQIEYELDESVTKKFANEKFKKSSGAVEAKEDPQVLPRFEDKKKKVSESLDNEEDEMGYMVVFGNDPDNFDEVRDFSKVFDTEEEAVQFIKDELALSDYRFAIVDEEEPSGSGRTFTVNPQGEVEEVTGNYWKYSYTDYEDDEENYEDYYTVVELDETGDFIGGLKDFTNENDAIEYADSLDVPAGVQYLYYDEETDRYEEDDIIYYNAEAKKMGLDESLDSKEIHENSGDKHHRCKKGKSKFRRDNFKFDDDFYGECIHKDCDEDDDEEIKMIFDDDPTISY